ncbi:MAG: hypothetical protein KDE47_33440, partial [Caldilineaceae bacterium]|nr:hypothetical protein [Caldilineaceae bacterium]
FDSDHMSSVFTTTLETLGLKYIRVQFGPDWDKIPVPPPACNDETRVTDVVSMSHFIADNFNGDYSTRLANALSIANTANNLDIETIFLNWRAHQTWHVSKTIDISGTPVLTYSRELDEKYVDDYACFIVENVKFLMEQGVNISYLEPTNEPSLAISDTLIPPDLYNTFVISISRYLEERNLSNVKLLAPGLPYLNHDGNIITYTMALSDIGVEAISTWSAHAWDPVFYTQTAEAETLRIKWSEFHPIVDAKGNKPIFITESACVNEPDNEICAAENLLTLYDRGANAVIYWYLKEQSWDAITNTKRTLLTQDDHFKPTYEALDTILPYIAGENTNVLKTNTNGLITVASFLNVDSRSGKKQVTVSLVNRFTETENISIAIADTLMSVDQVMYDGNSNSLTEDSAAAQCQLERGPQGSVVNCQELGLPSNSILTLTFTGYNFYLPIIKNLTSGTKVAQPILNPSD